MKRMICFMLCLIIPAAAYALSDLDIMVESHNQIRAQFGAKELQPEEQDENGWVFCNVTDYILVAYKIDEPTMIGGVTCDNESELPEFLAQCATVCYCIGNPGEYDKYYGVILRQFLQTRAGIQTQMESAGNLYISVYKSGDMYEMVASSRVF